mgnify:CR=1 FL=1|tara:strand:+ start:991 stop:1242 length:252 start_codon:yes stop_codon:yes gene_type:complete
MTLYTCKCCKESKDVGKTKIIYVDGSWVADVMCSCGKYMDSEPAEGMPNLIRTEPTLTKKRDNLWAGAKEKLIGERGINESFD